MTHNLGYSFKDYLKRPIVLTVGRDSITSQTAPLPYPDAFKRVADHLQTMFQNTLQEAVEDPAHWHAHQAIKDMCPGEAAKQ
jgi:hypothetical protein